MCTPCFNPAKLFPDDYRDLLFGESDFRTLSAVIQIIEIEIVAVESRDERIVQNVRERPDQKSLSFSKNKSSASCGTSSLFPVQCPCVSRR